MSADEELRQDLGQFSVGVSTQLTRLDTNHEGLEEAHETAAAALVDAQSRIGELEERHRALDAWAEDQIRALQNELHDL